MINAAIVGAGRWGQNLVAAVQGKSKRIRFVRAVTRTPAKAEAFCAEHGLALGADYAEALADADVDAVVLATPHTRHAAQIEAAAEAGKHVFCEKPFTLTRETAERAVAACAAKGLAVGVGHNRRFMPPVIEIQRLIETGALGTLLHADATFAAPLYDAKGAWRDSGAESPAGGMTSLGIHMVDTFIHLCGPIAEVDARSLRRAIPLDMDDTTVMLFGFASGMTGYLGTFTATAPLWHLRVFGSQGWADLRNHETLTVSRLGAAPEVSHYDYAYPGSDSLAAELEAFAEAAEGGAPFPIPPEEIVHGVAVLEAVVRSAESGARIAVP